MFLVEGERTIFSSKEEAQSIAKQLILNRKKNIHSVIKTNLCKQKNIVGREYINDEIKDNISISDIENIIECFKFNEQLDIRINEESDKLIKTVQYL